MKVTYIFHSCYIVETNKAIFVFDYYNGEVRDLPTDKPIYFFASHGHFDHCGKKVLTIGGEKQKKHYIFTEDIRVKPPAAEPLLYVEENQTYEMDGIRFHTFHSTDIGVAYLVETDEGNVFHAGDLNWWHWNGESPEFNRQMEADFKAEVRRIAEKGMEVEVAFLALDQRLENAYDWGMKYFMEQVPVKRAMPMHFFSENFDICKRAEKENDEFRDYDCKYVKIEHLHQTFEF